MDPIVHGITKSRTQVSSFHFHFSRKENEKHIDLEGRINMSLFADDVTAYVESPKVLTKNFQN